MSHGGPTGATSAGSTVGIQFWTSRGFARRRRQLRRQQRLRPRLPRAARRPVGHRRHRRLHQRRALPGRARARSTASGWRSAAAAPAATRRCARWSSTTSSPPARATTASPTPRRWPRDTHKFESRYLDGLIGPYPEAEATSTRALADPLRRSAVAAR